MRETPLGWTRTTYGSVLDKRKERSGKTGLLLSITADRGVIPQSFAGRRDISSRDKSLYRKVYPGDIVYNTMRMWQGVSGLSSFEGVVSPAYTVCTPREDIHGAFMALMLKHPAHIAAFRSHSQGMVSDTWNLHFRLLAGISITIPTNLSEQRRITEILDTLDERMEVERRTTVKLRTLRSSVVEQVVESLIYQHELAKLDELLLRIDAGWSPACDDSPPQEREWGVLKVSAVTSGRFRPEEAKVLPGHLSGRSEIRVQDGELIMARANGVRELIGVTARVEGVNGNLMLSDKLLRLVPREHLIHPKFLSVCLESSHLRRQIGERISGGTGQGNISQQSVRTLRVPAPSMEIQERAVEAVGCVDTEIRSVEGLLRKLWLVKEGLMEDLLTGKVQVTRSGKLTG